MCSKQHKAEIDAEYNLGIISRLYEGDSAAFWALLEEYKAVGKQSEVDWLLERWPEGGYQDVVGLCKVAKLEGEDIIGAINQQDDYAKTRNYWKCLKNKFKKENNEVVSATNQLKLIAPDGIKKSPSQERGIGKKILD